MMPQTIADIGDGYYIKVTVSDGSPSIRMTLDYTGMLTFRRWNRSMSSWTVFENSPVQPVTSMPFVAHLATVIGLSMFRHASASMGMSPMVLIFPKDVGERRSSNVAAEIVS